MPVFYLHIHQHDMMAEDEEGMEVPSLAVARKHALEGARAIMGEQLRKGHLHLSGYIRIVDGDGHVAAVVSFGDAVTITGLN